MMEMAFEPYAIGAVRVQATHGSTPIYDTWVWRPNASWAEAALASAIELAEHGETDLRLAFMRAASQHAELDMLLRLAAAGFRHHFARRPAE